ncbi:MAG: hypothetical protein JSS44_11325 [Proteobacteria bacterium]|nr:hypothetical protein [Pseudomonadota bacterium]
MLKGQLPTQQTMEAFETVTGLPPGTLQAWVAWPIWDLLSGRLTDLAMARALGSVKGPAREILHASAARLYSHSDSQRQPIAYDPHTWLAIRDLGDLNALVVLTMLACAVRRDLAHEPADTLGLITRALFCDAISRCPELYFRWKDLAILYEDAIWASIRMEGDTMLYSNKWGAMESDMAAAAASARQAGVPLCPERYVRTPLNWDSFVSMMKRGMTLSAGLPFR